MFNFKPKIYRSAEGCCICRAKSSSSRFTESQKYEEDFALCFDLKNPRRGQICNACVLLVKRYKRLPAGSQRNWGHVVDARAGPGTKTLMKVKRNKSDKSVDCTNNSRHNGGKSMITEKFSKIFKKSKKLKLQLSPNRHVMQSTINKKSDSIDSENEESSESSQEQSKTPPTVVLFQTQTRASAFRLKHKVANKPIAKTQANDLIMRRSLPKFSGSKKRKKLKPKKLQNPLEYDTVKFFDDNEWTKQTSCCGVFYECEKLNNAILIDIDQYKVCQHHQQMEEKNLEEFQQQSTALNMATKPKCVIKATLPAVVKLSLPFTTLNSNMKSTPVLKKHHLYFKRQSENFPQEDSTKTTTTTMTSTIAVPITTTVKTEDTETHVTVLEDTDNSTNILKTVRTIHSNNNSTLSNPIITSTVAVATPSSANNIKSSSSILHKIKSDAGKIVKHSFEKLNSAVRLKVHDLSEIKDLVKTVDKNYLLSKSAAKSTTQVVAADTKAEDLSSKSTATTPTSNKFNDNSSDSGFDENVQDRQSVSPMQQENDIKNVAPIRPPPVQTLILASGVRVHGQTQNLVYAGNETAAKILHNRLATQNSSTILQNNKRLNVQTNNTIDSSTTTPSVATLKIVQQPIKTNPNCVVSIGAYGGIKMRALYNSNAIKHENGITTILPASSLAAANQANKISMQANAPNTITITPAVAVAAAPTSLATSSSASTLSSLHNHRSTLPLVHSTVAYQQPITDNLTNMHNRKAI